VPQSLFQSELFQDAPAIADRLALPPRDGHFDELRGIVGPTQGGLRESWRQFFELLGADGFADLDRRLEVVSRQIHENGMTYTVYADEGPPRPWSLDLLPFVVEDAEWREIEAGIAQRAQLLEAIACDAYGPQRLIADGFVPSALVCGHPGYLREMHGVDVPGDVRLHIVAFDLGRGPDGRWSVVSQRTQAPSGLGYALENRLTISRLFPEAFSDLRIQHLAASYRRLVDMLETLVQREGNTMFDQPAPRDLTESSIVHRMQSSDEGREHVPRIVLLTPGPYNETYFEQAYLARYLGLPLVEGSDLTVRDERVYLKTMRGLERVHGILRRLDDDFCDPVELRSDSTIGVPGLLQAIRARHVLVANALGCGFLESPALNGFLPAIARHLTNQDLLLPSLASWWCGEAAARDAVSPDLAQRVVKPTYPSSTGRPSFEPLIGAAATASQLEAWKKRIDGDPDAYTVQSHLPLSQAPTWTGGRIVPRAAMLRVFAIAEAPLRDPAHRGGNGTASGKKRWHVVPGALARIANRDRQIVSMQRGGSSLDTWVRTEGPVDDFSMLPPKLQPEELIAARTTRARPVSSRAAENLFWMGRYTERAEYDVRLIRLVLNRLPPDDSLPPLFFDAVRELCITAGLVARAVPSPQMAPRVFERALIAGLPTSEDNRGVGFALHALSRAAGQIRDRLSPEHWRLVSSTIEDYSARLGSLQADEKKRDEKVSGSMARDALEHVGTQLYAITGAQTDRMTRDDGWRLLTIGRQIERLLAMSNALTIMLERDVLQSERERAFALVLGLFDSTITYRSLYQRRQELAALLDLLVFDEDNPRALATMVAVLRAEVARLPDTGTGPAAALLANFPLDGLDVTLGELVERDDAGRLSAALGLTKMLASLARQLSTDIALRYFSIVGDVWRTTAR
jgi:uncharacterized circularly permuted ATP-grasp superfamily protein/uncharacterized alpha-E superfamily protein